MVSRRRVGFLIGAATWTAVLVAGTAQAQAQTDVPGSADGAPPSTTSRADTRMEDIVVVARRVAERLQDVPITITALSSEVLQNTQVQSGTDLIKLVPSLNVQQLAAGPGVNYSLRGIRDGVITYLNEVPVQTAAVDDQIWDLSSVQALAGPQGTLFGKNGTGGAILFVPQRPTDKFEGYLDGSYGNHEYVQLNGVINIPVSDILKIRVGGRLVRHDPFIENIGGGHGMQSENRKTFRASILFEPTSSISNYTVFDYGRRNERPYAQITSDVSPTLGCFPGICFYPPDVLKKLQDEAALQDKLGIRKISQNFPNFDKTTNYGVSDILRYDISNNVTVKYIFGYRYFGFNDISSKTSFTVPIELGQGKVFGQKTWTNEVQLLGKAFDNRLNVTVGGFLSHDNRPVLSNYQLFAPDGAPFDINKNIFQRSDTINKSQAAYAQGTFAVTEGLKFTAGVRYTKDDAKISLVSMSPRYTFFGPEVCALPAGAQGVDSVNCVRKLDASFHAVTYNFSLDYRVSEGLLVYATTRRGYNGGGFNAAAPSPDVNVPGGPLFDYQPEYLRDYEAGIKANGTLAGIPVRAELSAYLAKYTNIQRTGYGVASNGSTYSGTINGPKATIYGATLEAAAKPFHDLTLNLNYGFLHTRFDEGSPGFPKGNVFAQAPKHTVNASATYDHDLAAGGSAFATMNYAYQSSIVFQDNNIALPFARQKGYGVFDAQIGWRSVLDSNFDVTVFARNLTNVVYAIDREDETALLGFVGTVYNDPRTFGVTLHYHFGS